MNFIDQRAYEQVLGCIMKNPALLSEIDNEITVEDFGTQIFKLLYSQIYNLIQSDVKVISAAIVREGICASVNFALIYNKNNGDDILTRCENAAIEENFRANCTTMKKLALLRDLYINKFDISYYMKETYQDNRDELECVERLSNSSLDDILNKIEGRLADVRKRFSFGTSGAQRAGDGMEELLQELEENPEIGPPMVSQMFSCACRGARKGKFYIRSSATNVGKTRLAVFDFCKICYPIHYGIDDKGEQGFIMEILPGTNKLRAPEKVLYITTEMTSKEIKTIILAYLSGVEEYRILDGTYKNDRDEKFRVKRALQIMKEYNDYFFLEEINDPNLTNIQATIKRHILINKVEYINYDYIFTSPSLISQFGGTGIREDVVLLMLSNQLKEIAKTYGVFVMSATQVNADGMKWDGKKDQSVLRGAKSIADKADACFLVSEACPEDLAMLSKAHAITSENNKPTHVIDIYKMRRGRWKGIRIWQNINLGNGIERDLFVTKQSYELMTIDTYETFALVKEKVDV